MSLTEARVRSAKAGDREVELADGRALFLVVGKGGTKTWVLRYRDSAGKSRRHLLGSYPDLKIHEARESASVFKRDLKQGIDPKPVAKPAGLTVSQCIGLYLEDYRARGHSRPDALAQRFDNDVVPYIGDKMILEVTDEELQRLINDKKERIKAKGKTGQGSLNLYLAISAFFNWCASDATGKMKTGLRNRTNPMLDVSKPCKAGERKRWFEDTDELRWLVQAINKAAGNHAKPFEMILRSSCRRNEIQTLTKSMVKLDDPERGDHLLIPDTKNGADHAVPLTKQMFALLPDLNGLKPDEIIWRSTYGRHAGAALCPTAVSKPKARVEAEMAALAAASGRDAPIAPWVIHDWRRTAASHFDRMGIAGDVIEALLTHKKKGVQKIYRRYEYFEERREALTKWNDFLDHL